MCSHFLKRMENYQQGDLTDILRASGGGGGSKTAAEEAAAAALADWQFPAGNNDTVNNNINTYPTDDPVDVFGDPFSSHMGDPLLLLHGINAAAAAVPASGLFLHSSSEETGNSSSSTVGFASNIDGLNLKRPNNMFSRMLQIAPNPKLPLPPCDSPAAAAAESPRGLAKAPDHSLIISPNSSKGCLLENSPGNLQISSPRNTGIRRRKSQAKKVVCIPAPAPANSRSSGEIVPSDLWAWRKYGQKPIKGSPYPRGYYRCSSSKGCSARKQVERSRTDPNMLVITYTSEHNHPWPTQRNALAGSTRSQPSSSSKNNNPSSSSQKSTRSNLQKHNHHHQEEHKLLEEESSTRGGGGDDTAVGGGAAVKEEEMEQDLDDHHHLEFDDNNQGFSHIYRPTLPDAAHHSEDSFLFADLGEIETDSLDILLTQGFSGEDDGPDSKSLDPFTFYDWASTGNNNNMISTTTTSPAATAPAGATTTTSYGEPANKNNDHP